EVLNVEIVTNVRLRRVDDCDVAQIFNALLQRLELDELPRFPGRGRSAQRGNGVGRRLSVFVSLGSWLVIPEPSSFTIPPIGIIAARVAALESCLGGGRRGRGVARLNKEPECADCNTDADASIKSIARE